METIKEAVEYLAEHMKEGVQCPCCKQKVQLYEVKLSRTMVKGLATILHYREAHAPLDGWVHIPTELPELQRIRKYPKLAHWELLEESPEKAGSWRVTKTGWNFMLGRIEIPQIALVYNAKVRGFNGPMIRIGEHFKDFKFGD
jgi:hypothetical protein